jgi:hypothetical protein
MKLPMSPSLRLEKRRFLGVCERLNPSVERTLREIYPGTRLADMRREVLNIAEYSFVVLEDSFRVFFAFGRRIE